MSKEIDSLKAELAELRAAVQAMKLQPAAEPAPEPEDDRPDWVPPSARKDNCGMWRDGRGVILTRPGAPSVEEQLAARRRHEAAVDAARAEYEGKDRDGSRLPDRFFRDSCGLVRERGTGRLAAVVEGEKRRAREVERETAVADRALRAGTLVRGGA